MYEDEYFLQINAHFARLNIMLHFQKGNIIQNNKHASSFCSQIALGPGRLPFQSAVFLLVCAFCFLLVGILVVGLRMQHVYLWDWGAQFVGPLFFIFFLLCISGASYLIILAKRRSNRYRSEIYVSLLINQS